MKINRAAFLPDNDSPKSKKKKKNTETEEEEKAGMLYNTEIKTLFYQASNKPYLI
ncbi:hypothetical protein [Bacteroides acidifaciens]|uniref:hypothetical protein n=1 Tax=Bacteroides acidifaciens TaxID=85831 RepID=UPI003F691D3C